jgi:hypothetical protein
LFCLGGREGEVVFCVWGKWILGGFLEERRFWFLNGDFTVIALSDDGEFVGYEVAFWS